jgi:DNA processing protein
MENQSEWRRWSLAALATLPGVESAGGRALLEEFGSPAGLLKSDPGRLREIAGPELAARIAGFDWQKGIAGQQERAASVGAALVLAGEPGYPVQLRTIPGPPRFLFVRGEIRDEDALAVAIVGSRHATTYGVRVAERLAGDLASRGVTVVSGLARGADSAAHRGALNAGGRTLAVLGSGVDVIYPPENRKLAEQVAARGALVSQLPMGSPPFQAHFPLRNRTIAGLSLGTVVVEAAERSGALITAGCSGELGREVFAVPGNVTSDLSRGTNGLIQDGAKLVREWSDVVAELPEVWRRCLKAPVAAVETEAPRGDEGRLLDLLGGEPVHIEELIERSGIGSGKTAALLLGLEIRGWVRQLEGKMYVQSRGA